MPPKIAQMNTALSSPFLAAYPIPSISTNILWSRENRKEPRCENFIVHSSRTSSFPQKLIESTSQTPHEAVKITKFNHGDILVAVFNRLDDFISTFLDLPLQPSIDPAHILAGNFAPVDELPPTVCEVMEGSLPSCLDGAYIRNGPNPQFIPKGPYHYFDGDGMLHMIKICKGKATFCSRYVKTYKYLMEREIGHPFIPSIFASFNGLPATIARFVLNVARVAAGNFDPVTHGFGVANTSLAVIGGRLYALCESDLPYEVKPTSSGDITTLDRNNFHSREPFLRMTAHPKIDQETGKVFAYGYNLTPPFITFFSIDSQGRKGKELPIYSMKEITGIHDFAVTKNYIIFPDLQIVVNPWRILRGKSPVGINLHKVPRLGIIPKNAEDETDMLWIDVPGFNMLHCFNAWEEDGGNTIVVIASNMASVEQMFDNMESVQLMMDMITIDVKAKTVQRHPLSAISLDFAVINPAYSTKKMRYLYAGVIGQTSWEGIVKLDLSLSGMDGCDCIVARRMYEPGWCWGEPFFVAREPNNPAAEEDDGYLVAYVHDENDDESMFLVMDAKSPTLHTVAAVKLPHRVPNGIHGLFLSQDELKALH